MFPRHGGNMSESVGDDPVELAVDLILGPEVTGEVLHPFEIADNDAPGVGQDVRNHDDAVTVENIVRLGRRWSIGTLDNEGCANTRRSLHESALRALPE